MELLKTNDYILSIGPMIIPYFTAKNQNELAEYLRDLIDKGCAFVIDIDKNGPKAIINPAPGMVIIVMTKEQFERNRGMQQIIGKS